MTVFFLVSLYRITTALQTATRLSQQAELGGILEEIEVSFTSPLGGAVLQVLTDELLCKVANFPHANWFLKQRCCI